MQSRWMSLLESFVNVMVGYLVAIATQIVVFPIFGLRPSFGDQLLIGVIFSAVSIGRSYIMRRIFNALS